MFLTKRFHQSFVLILMCIFISACGPSPEELAATSAAETAAAATSTPTTTPTPTPTSTPTPVPYDLSISVIGEEDAPVAGASIFITEIGEDGDLQLTDDSGQAVWHDLPGETVNISISAQGYMPIERIETIQRGENQVTVTLERDLNGILPSEACLPEENMLYIEDFQDGEAQGWTSIELRAQGWNVVPDPEIPEDQVLFKPAEIDGHAGLKDLTFDNSVWRLKFMPIGKPIIWFNLPWNTDYDVDGTTVEWSAYQLFFHPPGLRSFRAQPPISSIFLHDVTRTMESNVWHHLEISRYNGTFEIWIDGHRFLTYEDPKPLPAGQVHFGVGLGEPMDPDTLIYYDDFVVCELTAPFAPMPASEQ